MTLDVVTALFTNGQADRAVALCREHVQQNPSDPQGWDLLGIMYYNLRQHRPALEAVARARDLAPEDPRILGHLGAVLKAMGRLPEAEKAILASLDRAPENPEVLNNYGNLLSDMHRAFEAEEAFRRVIALDPGNASAYGNMAYTMFLLGRNNEGEAFARRGLKVDPDSALLQNSMGSAIMGQDRMVEAAGYFRRAVELDPGFTVAHSNLLFCRNYDPEASAEEIFADYRAWDDLHGRPLVPAQPVYDNDRDPERKIRLGLVSPDFRRHAANFFLEPLLEAHDRNQVELYLYGMVAAPDRHTERYKELATAWRNVTGLSDEEMATQIREDRIDILVDLAGHTAKHRLTAFALRPAPVMVAYLVGLGYTTGMSVFDGFFADDAMAPPDAAHLFSEPVLRLTRFPMTYRPPAEMPAVGPLPAARGQGITFGSFCRTVRINARVIRAWARILQAVPGSRLMLNTKSFAEAETRQTYRDLFAREGIAAERLQLVYTQPQSVTWEAYNAVDIALDPFPHNAGTTTFEALWMGVPVITRMDRPSVGRFGASILHSLGYPEWVAPDDDGYVRRAVALAGDVKALAAIRHGLRERMRSSPLLDARGLAREMEGHYRRLWRGWCLGRLEPQPSVPVRADLLYRQGGQEQPAGTAAAASGPPDRSGWRGAHCAGDTGGGGTLGDTSGPAALPAAAGRCLYRAGPGGGGGGRAGAGARPGSGGLDASAAGAPLSPPGAARPGADGLPGGGRGGPYPAGGACRTGAARPPGRGPGPGGTALPEGLRAGAGRPGGGQQPGGDLPGQRPPRGGGGICPRRGGAGADPAAGPRQPGHGTLRAGRGGGGDRAAAGTGGSRRCDGAHPCQSAVRAEL